jgi:hypothetical protein
VGLQDKLKKDSHAWHASAQMLADLQQPARHQTTCSIKGDPQRLVGYLWVFVLQGFVSHIGVDPERQSAL